MKRVAAGDRNAAAELFQRHGDAVYRYLRAAGVPGVAAEDLTQDVFVTALSKASSYRADGSLRGWLIRIARTRMIDEARRQTSRVMRERRFAESLSHCPAPESEKADLLRSLIATLPPDDREILVLSRFLDMPAPRIGRILGMTPGAVRVRLHRALARLAERYAEVQTS